MRLIDADELLSRGNRNGCYVLYDPIKYTDEYGYVVKLEDITSMPTVEAEPIRHGYWVKINNDNDRWKCSCCGYNFIGFNGLHQTFAEMCDYCPCCGAKMDEVENNGEMDKT